MDVQEMHSGQQRPLVDLRGMLRIETAIGHIGRRRHSTKRRVLDVWQVHAEESSEHECL